MTFATSTLQSTLCRLENYTTECPAADTAQPHHLDWGSMSAPISLDAYVRYPDCGRLVAEAPSLQPYFAGCVSMVEWVFKMEYFVWKVSMNATHSV